MVQLTTLLAVLVTGTTIVHAHPGQSHESKLQELNERSEYISQLEKRDLAHCVGKLSKRGDYHGMVSRRQEKLKALRRAKGLEEHAPHYKAKRQNPFSFLGFGGPKVLPASLQKSHKSNLTITDFSHADWAMLGQNKTTVLHPEVTEGPYYVSGEIIRKNVKDGQGGIDLHLDIQVIDMASCTPMPGIAVEMWSANATGVYSGVVDFMNGGLKSDTKVVNNQALRGFQVSDKDGAVEFETIVPGHYQGRAHHIHVATHLNPSIQTNGTIASGQILHVGQVYLDQDLLNAVEKNEPYKSNKAPLTLNKDDMLLTQGSGGNADPVVEYVLLGPDIKDGVFAWINFGVDSKAKRTMRPATVCTETGCKSGTADMLKSLEGFTTAVSGAWGTLKEAFGLGSAPKSDPAAGGVPAASSAPA